MFVIPIPASPVPVTSVEGGNKTLPALNIEAKQNLGKNGSNAQSLQAAGQQAESGDHNATTELPLKKRQKQSLISDNTAPSDGAHAQPMPADAPFSTKAPPANLPFAAVFDRLSAPKPTAAPPALLEANPPVSENAPVAKVGTETPPVAAIPPAPTAPDLMVQPVLTKPLQPPLGPTPAAARLPAPAAPLQPAAPNASPIPVPQSSASVPTIQASAPVDPTLKPPSTTPTQPQMLLFQPPEIKPQPSPVAEPISHRAPPTQPMSPPAQHLSATNPPPNVQSEGPSAAPNTPLAPREHAPALPVQPVVHSAPPQAPAPSMAPPTPLPNAQTPLRRDDGQKHITPTAPLRPETQPPQTRTTDTIQALPTLPPRATSSPVELTNHDADPRLTDTAFEPPQPRASNDLSVSPTQPRPEATSAQELTKQMVAHLQSSQTRQTELQLYPEELGRLRMTLQTTETGVTLMIQADRPETADLLKRHLPVLTSNFAALGFSDIAFSFGQNQHAQASRQEPEELSAVAPTEDTTNLPARPPRQIATESTLDLRL